MVKKVTTMLVTDKGVRKQEGNAGFTVTASYSGNNVHTRIEHSAIPDEIMREMVGVLLCMLDDVKGEAFVASCFAAYAEETDKAFLDEGNGRKLVIIRGDKRDGSAVADTGDGSAGCSIE